MIDTLFQWTLSALFNGLGGWALVHTAINLALGTFFLCSGANKLWCGARHRQFCRILARCRVPALRYMRWVVAGTVFLSGLGLILGVATPFWASALIVILTYALATDGIPRLRSLPKWRVVNRADWIAWFLYLPEVWYVIALLVPLSLGAHPWSIDRLLIGG